MTVFGSYNVLRPELIQAIMDHISDNLSFMKYQTLADITVLFSTSTPKQTKDVFYKRFGDRIVSNIPYANDEVYYKFLWSFTKADMLSESDYGVYLKAFIDNHVEFTNKLFIKSMILLSRHKDHKNMRDIYNAVGKSQGRIMGGGGLNVL